MLVFFKLQLAREKFSVNKQLKLYEGASFLFFFFQISHLAFTAFISKSSKLINWFLSWRAEEKLVVNNKDNKVFVSEL